MRAGSAATVVGSVAEQAIIAGVRVIRIATNPVCANVVGAFVSVIAGWVAIGGASVRAFDTSLVQRTRITRVCARSAAAGVRAVAEQTVIARLRVVRIATVSIYIANVVRAYIAVIAGWVASDRLA